MVRGNNADIRKWPWMTYIVTTSDTQTIKCGGTIIRRNYIITSAHCVKNSKPNNIKVYTGINDITALNLAYNSSVKKIIRHKGYNASMAEESDHDLALLKLTNNLPKIFGRIQVLPLASRSSRIDEIVETCITAGWGLTSFVNKNSIPNELQEFKLKYMSYKECNKNIYAKSRKIKLSSKQFCAIKRSPLIKGTNRGDSGGPFMCQKGNKWELYGVIKMGDGTELSIFMDVRKYKKWIWTYILFSL
ncbi:unnamed protein product [Gordionus sp. m RMFG-2023]